LFLFFFPSSSFLLFFFFFFFTFSFSSFSSSSSSSSSSSFSSSSYSSVDATARCGFWPVEQYLSIFPYLSPTLSIFSLPALEDLLSTSSLHPFLGLPLYFVPSSS
jgi:hypothetical protein